MFIVMGLAIGRLRNFSSPLPVFSLVLDCFRSTLCNFSKNTRFFPQRYFLQRCKLITPICNRVETWVFSPRTPLVILVTVSSLGSKWLNLPAKWQKRSITGESHHNCLLLQLCFTF